MAHSTRPTDSSGSGSGSHLSFSALINDALEAYNEHTGIDLMAHSLTDQVVVCQTSKNILDILQEQLDGLDQSRRRHEQLLVYRIVKTLHKFLAPLGEAVGVVFPPAKAIFAVVGIFLLVQQISK